MSCKTITNAKNKSLSSVVEFSLVILTLCDIAYVRVLPQPTSGQWHNVSAHRDNRAFSMQIENLAGAPGRVVLVVIPGKQADLDELGGKTLPAEVCVAEKPGSSCYIARVRDKNFARNVKASVLSIDKNTAALLFQAEYWLINDTLRLVAILGANDRGEIVNLMPPVVLSTQGQFRLWREEEISDALLITTAEYFWTALPPKETHFSRHHYTIRTYEWCPKEQHYLLLDQFRTRRKFPGFDAQDDPAGVVLDSLKAQVRERARQKQNVCARPVSTQPMEPQDLIQHLPLSPSAYLLPVDGPLLRTGCTRLWSGPLAPHLQLI